MKDDRNTKILLFAAGCRLGQPSAFYGPRRRAPKPAESSQPRRSRSELIDKTREFYEAGLRIAEEAAELFEDGRKLVKG